MGLPFLGISQQPFFFSPDFGAVQKDFTVSEEVCPPTLSPVFLSVSLSTTFSHCLAHLNNHSNLTQCFLFDGAWLMPVTWAPVSNGLKAMQAVIAANPWIKQACSSNCGQVVIPSILTLFRS